MHCSVYKKSNKKTKSAIAWKLVKFIQNLSPPGRFLRKNHAKSNEWEIVDDKIAKEKMNQSLRDAASGKDAYKNLAVQHSGSAAINCFLPPALKKPATTSAAGSVAAADDEGKASAATSAALSQLLNQDQLSLLEHEAMTITNGSMNRSYADIHASLLQQLQHQQLLRSAAQQEQMHGLQQIEGMFGQQQQNQSELSELVALSNQQSLINGRLSDLVRQHAYETLSALGLQQLPPSFDGALGVRSPIVDANTQIGTARHALQLQQQQQTVNAVNYLRALIVAEEIRKQQL